MSTTQLATAPGATAIQQLQSVLDNQQTSISAVLPEGVSFEKVRTEIIALALDYPQLAQPEYRNSLTGSLIQILGLGLTVNRSMREAYLVPFQGKVTPIIGPDGYVKLMYASGMVDKTWRHCVYEGDEFDIDLGSDAISHKPGPNYGSSNFKLITGAYACALLKSGTIVTAYLTRDQIDRIRASSPAGNNQSGPWVKWFDMMCMAKANKALGRLIPKVPALGRAMEIDEMEDLPIDGSDPEAVTAAIEAQEQEIAPQQAQNVVAAALATAEPVAKPADPEPKKKAAAKKAAKPEPAPAAEEVMVPTVPEPVVGAQDGEFDPFADFTEEVAADTDGVTDTPNTPVDEAWGHVHNVMNEAEQTKYAEIFGRVGATMEEWVVWMAPKIEAAFKRDPAFIVDKLALRQFGTDFAKEHQGGTA